MRSIPPDKSPWLTQVVCWVLFVGTLLLFSRAIGHDFVNYDDPDYVTANDHVQAGLTFDSVYWAFFSANISYWHPLTWLSHLLDWTVFGSNPHGHHATSVILHAGNAVLAFLALRRLSGANVDEASIPQRIPNRAETEVGSPLAGASRSASKLAGPPRTASRRLSGGFWTSAFGAALFAWHPLRVESVAWIAERKDVLSGLFFFLTIWAYARYVEKHRARRPGAWRLYALTLAAFAGGLMSKPMLVTLPALLLLLDFWPLRRLAMAASPSERTTEPREHTVAVFGEKVPFVALSAAVGFITYLAQEKVGTLSHALSFDARAANAAVALVAYLGKFLWPFNLAVLYPHPGHWPAATIIGASGVLLLITAVALAQWRQRPWLLTGWLWFVGMLIPVLGFVQVGIQSMADRYTYLPMLGVQLALLWTVREAVTQPAAQRVLAACAALLLLGCAARTWDQLGVWRDSGTLFGHAVRVTRNSYLAYNNLGTHAFAEGRVDEAISCYRESLAIRPDYEEANNNLGHALTSLGRPREAIAYFEQALRTKPALLEAHNNLGNALADLGQVDEAITHYEFVLARHPAHVEALNNLGVALAIKGRTTEALARFQTVLQLKPGHAGAHSNRGNLYAMLGRRDDAISEYRIALQLNPADARTLNNLGNALAQQNKLTDAASSYEEALRLEPINPEAHANYGLILARLGRRDDAIQHLRLALQQRPDYPDARTWLNSLLPPVTGSN